jgi:hypothetical protein
LFCLAIYVKRNAGQSWSFLIDDALLASLEQRCVFLPIEEI